MRLFFYVVVLLHFVPLKSCSSFGLKESSIKESSINESSINEFPLDGYHMGWATDTKGGAGGKILKVTNLNASGPGSLIEAMESKGSRIVVFEVAGIIDFEGRSPKVVNSNLTIAGQTAPAPGITIINGGIRLASNDIIIQHLRIRPGDSKSGKSIDGLTTTNGAYNVIIDHCSFSWAIDENLSVSGFRFEGENPDDWRLNTSHKITLSNNIISEGLYDSKHISGASHSMGTLVHDNVTEVLVLGNLYYCNDRRNPMFKGGARGAIVNNFIFNPGSMAIAYKLVKDEWKWRKIQKGKMSIVGNVMRSGINTSTVMIKTQGPLSLYVNDNLSYDVDGNKISPHNLSMNDLVSTPPIWISNMSPIPATKVEEYVLENAGARPWDRDVVDSRIIWSIKNNVGAIINSEKSVGGYPFYIKNTVKKSFKENEWDLGTMKRVTDSI